MIGCLIILIIFTFPETAYNRSYDDSDEDPVLEDKKDLYRASTGLPSKKKSYRGAIYTRFAVEDVHSTFWLDSSSTSALGNRR
jgi:hypothetical protein